MDHRSRPIMVSMSLLHNLVKVVPDALDRLLHAVLGLDLGNGLLEFGQCVAQPLDLGVAQPTPFDPAESRVHQRLLDYFE